MSEKRSSSQSSEGSLMSYRSVEHQTADSPSPDSDNTNSVTPDADSPPVDPLRRIHRVHFGADRRFEYGSLAEEGGFRPDASHFRRRSSAHRSLDITDAPGRILQALGREAGEEAKDEKRPPSMKEKMTKWDRLRAIRDTVKAKTSEFAARLGRPDDIDEDDLQPIDYRRRSTDNDLHYGEEHPDQTTCSTEAHRIVRELAQEASARRNSTRRNSTRRGSILPDVTDVDPEDDGLERDDEIGRRASTGGVLSHLLKLSGGWDQFQKGSRGVALASELFYPFGGSTPGTATPRKEKVRWYKKPGNVSTSTLVGAGSASGASTPLSGEIMSVASRRRDRHSNRHRRSSMRLEDEIHITLQIAEIIARQRYIMHLCKALMRFGAPTHRLEEYMHMTAKVLDIECQFLYLPGCMIISFDDPSTRTTEVKLVRAVQGVDLGRLSDTHNVYKNVIHDMIGVEEAANELDELMIKKPRFNKWTIVLVYGIATATVGPFAFDARPIDMPLIFFNGCLLGCMQHILAPRSVLYSNVFEVTASVLTSFLARAFGSIRSTAFNHGTSEFLFCFSAIAQSSIALILPGYLVLCSSLELQSHQIVAGSIRMVYAIIYSLFLGYGVTVGTTIYGLMDRNATSDLTCPAGGAFKNAYAQRFPFVAAFSLCLLIVNQGKWKQAPIMITISLAGYITNYFVGSHLGSNTQVANTVGAFTVGVMGNLYSRIWHGHAAAAVLPAIFVLVPSGLAATGSLITGVDTANEIRSNVTNHSSSSTSSTSTSTSSSEMSTNVLGFGMIQVAIGITVGLFVAALVVYPFGKRRSGLFSF
ncbi:DUF1212-domain-containing protein [Aspergillus heteromorphus CBS 117.55]|uniref:DUF1212-domain-containing protein n=1 Tax=Aspergillus heteromorphus CBS 117.55 TaxID=1448321 RepID=A0A317VRE6_9EURO|nr:DUF1212-domain-containing protein [Aspergillus heteromorphus CBS 117.55]PWY75468.1 DUF1212-domain-containing protein [Aspergillus heteromorphus CBS 117.55]